MNRQVVVRMVVVLFALLGLSLFPLKAQKIYATDTETGEKTFVLTYGWGITGYASSHGISAWDVDGKGGGVANLLKAMCYSSSSEVGYGGLLYGNTHSQRFQAEGVKELETCHHVPVMFQHHGRRSGVFALPEQDGSFGSS